MGAQETTLDRFKLGDELGAGGMGRVLRAVDTTNGAVVAVKLVHGSDASAGVEDSPSGSGVWQDNDAGQELRQRFLREVKTAAALHHPNICRVVGWGASKRELFMAMELIEGPSAQKLHRRHRLPLALSVELVRQLCEGLDHAHHHGVIHRDIKPANIMVAGSGVVKLVDFGIARAVGDETLTQTGALLGTPAYMSPEQVTGGVVDGKTDLFAAGATLLTLASGRMRFAGMEPTSILLKVSREPAPTLFEAAPQASPALARVVARATSLDPARRFSTGAEMAAALRQTPEWQTLGSADAAVAEIAAFLKAPDEVRDRLNQRLRASHVRRATAAEARGAHDAALLARRAASLCVDDDTIMREPADTEAIVELRRALEQTPTAPGLLKRLADLYRAHDHPRLAAAFLLRYLQERPSDSHATTQLAVLADGEAPPGPAFQRALSTREIVDGIATGGGAAQAVVATRHRERGAASSTRGPTDGAVAAPAAVVLMGGGGEGPRLPRTVYVVGAMVVAGLSLAFFSRFVDRTVDHVQQEVSDNQASIGRFEENNAERRHQTSLQKARGLLERGHNSAVVTEVTTLLAQRPPTTVVLDAVLLRAAAREALGDATSARLDLELFLRESGVDDPRRAAAKTKLDELYARLAPPPTLGAPQALPVAGGPR